MRLTVRSMSARVAVSQVHLGMPSRDPQAFGATLGPTDPPRVERVAARPSLGVPQAREHPSVALRRARFLHWGPGGPDGWARAVRRAVAREARREMSKLMGVCAAAGLALAASGCATTGDLEALESRVAGLESRLGTVEGKVGDLDRRFADVESRADAASQTAERAAGEASAAAQRADDAARRADAMFKKTVSK